jgi:nicotinamide-nucleotide amidase
MTGSAGSAPGQATSWIIAVGDELLLGQTVDTNGAWMGSRLAGLGVPCVGRTVVGDDDESLARAVAEARERAAVVILCGGLGPTRDDRTRPAVAAALGVGLVESPLVLEALRAHYAHVGDGTVPPANRGLAQIPRGATPLLNPVGTAPGIAIDADPGLVVLLPGVPRELRALWPRVEEVIREVAGDTLLPVYTRMIYTTGIAESLLAPRVEARLASADPGEGATASLAYLPDLTGVKLRLTTAAPDRETAAAALDRTEALLEPVVGPWRIPGGSGDLARAVVEALKGRGWTVGLGESCTGGLVARRITDVPGASSVFNGGVVAYANQMKSSLLQVPPEVIEANGAVSEPVALAMARGAAAAARAECGVGITGIAGPGGGSEEKPVGTVWIGVHTPGGTAAFHQVFRGDREAIRIRAAQAALRHLLQAVEETG